MQKLLIILILSSLSNSISLAQCKDIISNKDIEFIVWKVSKKLKSGLSVSGGYQVNIENDNITKFKFEERVDDLIQALSSKKCDFTANIILYSISRRNALSILSMFFSSFDENGKFKYTRENSKLIDLWRKEIKYQEIEYWKNWRDVYFKNGKIIIEE